MGLKIVQVDAFTDRPFSGNPAAVCFLSAAASESWMRDVAREMNLSETAFLHPVETGYHLRWFTPTTEVDLCGHATLAAAHVLWEEGILPPKSQARFETRSGPLIAVRRGDWIEMDFPAEPERQVLNPAEIAELAEALNLTPVYVGKNRLDYLVAVDSEKTVRALQPDYARLAVIPVRGVMVTSRSESGGFDFVSRFFGPRTGINEDPVTGSAHCCLGPFWGRRLNRTELTAYQASARGGTVKVRLRGPRVDLAGKAVTVLEGELFPGPA